MIEGFHLAACEPGQGPRPLAIYRVRLRRAS
jgi:hypothetical protein